MFHSKSLKIFVLSITTTLILGNLVATSVQANTIKKTSTSKAGRVATPGINTLLSGKGAPKSTLGIDGDFYIDTSKTNLYGPKTNGKWPAPVSLKGTAGTNGTNGTNGLIGATGATGAKGTSTTGSDGAPGPSGATGPAGSGSPGANGAPGINGSPGTNGTNGTPGSTGGIGPRGETGTVGLTGPAGSNNVTAINLTGAGGGVTWGLSSATGVVALSSPFGNLQPNTKYRFTIFITGSANRTGFAALPVGSLVTLDGAGATLNYSTQYGTGVHSDSAYTKTFIFSFLHEGTVTVTDSVSSLTVSIIDGLGWSAEMNTNAFEIVDKEFIQVS
jgi:hypothetical protein